MNIKAALNNLDSPIQSVEEDLLQRSGFVEILSNVFKSASINESTVFALQGEWGSGKTSVKNLLLKEFEKQGDESPIPIEFNPWAFSGQDQVLEAFFSEIGKAVGHKTDGKEAAEGFKKLGAYLSFGSKTVNALHLGMDLFGIPGSKLVGMVSESLEGGAKNVKDYGEEIETAGAASLEKVQGDLINGLKKLKRPLLIILDDLDRLTPDQLLVVFQIVKLNVNLPGVNYLLLMDIQTVTERLKHKQLGSEYIEKIIQFDFTLPHVPPVELKAILKDGFKAVMGKYEKQINWERWEDAWIKGMQDLFTTLRRIKRLLQTLKFSLAFFANEDAMEVDPVDLFLVEAVRKFAPQTHALIPREFRDSVIFEDDLMRALRLYGREKSGEHDKKKLAELIAAAPEGDRDAIQGILTLLFPQINDSLTDEGRGQALRDSRVCHQLSFDSYFRMAIPFGLVTQQEMAELFRSLNDNSQLRERLNALYKKAGLSNLLHLIYCHRQKLDPKYLSTMLAELWHLEDLDANRAGVERDWTSREGCYEISRHFLHEFAKKANRREIAEEVLNLSKVFYPLLLIWCRENETLTKSPGTIGFAFDAEDLKKLRPLILKAIHEAASDGHLLKMPDLGLALRLWGTMEGKEVAQSWLDEQSKEATKLVTILKWLINKYTVSAGPEMKTRYSISQQVLKQFFDPIEKLEAIISGVDVGKLAHWEKFAVEETLKRIDEKKRGVKEASYSFPNDVES